MRRNSILLSSLAAGAGWLLIRHLRSRNVALDLNKKVVLITGGSRGLGLATAREFGRQGAVVAICARDGRELARAEDDLRDRGIETHAFVCDVSKKEQVEAMIAQITERLARIDVLVNNAGVIKVGPLENMNIADFEEAMGVMFWGTLYTTLAALPAMRARKQGRIVNITSVGGKVSIPHLLPYSCAKFATVALSEGLRSELAPAGIQVTTIVPGLLRTGSHLHAEFKGNQADEYAWFAAGAATPFISINAERAARSIVRATVRGDAEKVLSMPAEVITTMQALLPSMTAGLLEMANRMLPDRRESFTQRDGSSIEAEANSSLWKIFTRLGQNAAESLNEL